MTEEGLHRQSLAMMIQIREFLTLEMTKEHYRMHPQDFSRNRLFNLPTLVLAIMYGSKLANQQRINGMFADLLSTVQPPSGSAFFQAREKLAPEIFKALNTLAINHFYDHNSSDINAKRWKGHRLLAVDGSTLDVPDSSQTRNQFTVIQKSSGSSGVQAGSSYLYDIENKLVINAAIGSLHKEPLFVIEQHAPYFRTTDLIIYDRGYVSYSFIVWHLEHQTDFIIRSPLSRSFNVIAKFVKNPSLCDTIVTLACPRDQRYNNPSLPPIVQVRLVKFQLSTGEWEVLITSLISIEKYPWTDFSTLYFKRWGLETWLNPWKNLWEIEKFSSGKTHMIFQDFFAAIFRVTLTTLLSLPAAQELRQDLATHPCKYSYALNYSVIVSTTIHHLVKLFVFQFWHFMIYCCI